MREWRFVMLMLASAGLAACFASKPDAPPPIVATISEDAPPPAGLDLHGIELQRVQVDIPRGTSIGEIREPPLSKCYGRGIGRLQVEASRGDLQSAEWKDTFHRIMSGHGYRVTGSPTNLFEREQEAMDAEYIFGANITEVAVDGTVLCDFVTAEAKGLNGTSRIMVEWQLFDPLKRRIVYREKIEGRYVTDRVMPIDHILMIKMAFADSVNKLAGKGAVRDLVANGPSREAPLVQTPARLALKRQPLSTQPIDTQIERIKTATVIIEANGGHGSGFIVSPEGLVVTNQHVVGSQRFVRVTLLSGRAVTGEVLRRDDRRDVALLKIEGGGYPVMAIRETPVRVTEEVYAIGAPVLRQLGWTVTRGVVSAWRQARPPRQPHDLIQADVAIHGGNSGGPLLDRQGNVVAISVIGWAMDETKRNTSLNGFIPILDGLDKLGLDPVDPVDYERRRQVSAAQ